MMRPKVKWLDLTLSSGRCEYGLRTELRASIFGALGTYIITNSNDCTNLVPANKSEVKI